MLTTHTPTARVAAAIALCVLAGAALLVAAATAPPAGAQAPSLSERVADARAQAEGLAAEIRATADQLAAAQGQALAAAAREEELTALLATGQERAAELSGEVDASRERLERERRRLGRARSALADQLVAIYMTGTPDPADIVLSADGFDDLVTRSGYMESIEDAGNDLAARVKDVKEAVAARLATVRRLHERVVRYNARLEAARAQIASVRAAAESAAAELAAINDSRTAQIATLQSSISGWVADIEAAREAAARRAEEEAAAAAEAESAAAEVESWLGGPYSIPAYIVMCESGGNYSAVNPSSGAGGAYQILPSTWELYGGEGAPHEAPKSEQDRIAAEIWADSGGGAWVCAG